MKGFKPQRLGFIQRVVEHNRRCTMVVSIFVYTPLDNGRALLTDQSMWMELGEILPNGVLDEGFPKPRSEVIVTGSAYAPGGEPTAAVMAGVELKRDEESILEKKIAAFGSRHWTGSSPTDPVPFDVMPLTWENAFGGEGFAKNPVGKGVAIVDSEHGDVHPLPNIENPKDLVLGKKDRPDPVGFAPYPLDWPQRFELMGRRYDTEWLATRFPGPAEDFDAHFYNAAPRDQQVEGEFRGDETFVLEGLHPDKPRLRGELSPLVVRAFVTQRVGPKSEEGEDVETEFKAIETRLDTLHFFPDRERLVSVYRGTLDVADDEGDDILHLMIAAEDPEHPKPLEHYQHVLEKRLDKDEAALEMLNDADLMPSVEAGWSSLIDPGEIGEIAKIDNLKLANAMRGVDDKLAETQATLEGMGMDVSEAFQRPEVPELPDDPYDIDAAIALARVAREKMAELQAQMDEVKETGKRLESEAHAAMTEAGFDWEGDLERAAEQADAAMDYSAEDHLVMLHDMARISAQSGVANEQLDADLSDPRYEASLRELEVLTRDSLQRFAHMMPQTSKVSPEQANHLRVLVQASHDAGESLAGRRLKGADLSGLDLSGIDLSEAVLAGADLSGADLSGANLSRAVLVKANLTEANLSGADLTLANIGATELRRTNFTDAKLDETVFMQSTLDGAIFHGAKMKNPDFLETSFLDVDFSYTESETPLFVDTDLRGATFTGASMELGRFLQVDVRGVDFTGVSFPKAQFSCAQCDGAVFSGADLSGGVFVYKTSVEGCDFTNANLDQVNFSGTSVRNGKFAGATMNGAALIKSDVRGSDLSGVVGQGLMAMRADLRESNLRGSDLLGAIMQKADLRGASLRGCNLSRGDVSLVRKDAGTDMAEALMLDTRVHPEAPNEGES